jgi:hypothetical protein
VAHRRAKLTPYESFAFDPGSVEMRKERALGLLSWIGLATVGGSP